MQDAGEAGNLIESVDVALYHVALAALGFSVAFGLHRVRGAEGDGLRRELRTALACRVLLAFLAPFSRPR
jgi:hypothetical protein